MIRKYFFTCTVKPVLSDHSKRRPKIGFQDGLLLNAGQKYCRMLPLEHSAILLTFIKLPFVIKIFFLSFFEWLLKTGFTVRHLYCGMIFGYGFGLEIVAWENLIMIPLITVIIHQPVSHKINHWSLSEDIFSKLLDLYIIQINVLGLTTIHCISKLSSFCFLTCLEAYYLGL